LTPSASTPASSRACIHSSQSWPPITVTVSAISCSVAGSISAWMMTSLLVSMAVDWYGAPIGFSAERTSSPESGNLRTGEASEYTTRSTWPRSALINSMTLARMACEKASPFTLLAYRPAACAAFSKAAELYQPAVPGLLSVAGFSRNTPSVAAPEPKAAAMREASP